MRKPVLTVIMVAILLEPTEIPGLADTIYKCRNEEGMITFRNDPCFQGEILEKKTTVGVVTPSSTALLKGDGPTLKPPPGPAKVTFLEHSIIADDRGNAILMGKIQNQTETLAQRIDLEATFTMTDGTSKKLKSSQETLKRGETRDFVFKTDIPLTSVNRYHVDGQYLYFRSENMPPR